MPKEYLPRHEDHMQEKQLPSTRKLDRRAPQMVASTASQQSDPPSLHSSSPSSNNLGAPDELIPDSGCHRFRRHHLMAADIGSKESPFSACRALSGASKDMAVISTGPAVDEADSSLAARSSWHRRQNASETLSSRLCDNHAGAGRIADREPRGILEAGPGKAHERMSGRDAVPAKDSACCRQSQQLYRCAEDIVMPLRGDNLLVQRPHEPQDVISNLLLDEEQPFSPSLLPNPSLLPEAPHSCGETDGMHPGAALVELYSRQEQHSWSPGIDISSFLLDEESESAARMGAGFKFRPRCPRAQYSEQDVSRPVAAVNRHRTHGATKGLLDNHFPGEGSPYMASRHGGTSTAMTGRRLQERIETPTADDAWRSDLMWGNAMPEAIDYLAPANNRIQYDGSPRGDSRFYDWQRNDPQGMNHRQSYAIGGILPWEIRQPRHEGGSLSKSAAAILPSGAYRDGQASSGKGGLLNELLPSQ